MAGKINPRVLMIGPSLDSLGGMAAVERQLIDMLSRNGTAVEFIASYDDCGLLKRTAIAGAAFLELWHRVHSFDIVHLHMASKGSYARKAVFARLALKAGKKVVVHLHGGGFLDWFDDGVSEAGKQKIVALLNSVDAIIVLSEEWREWMTERGFDRHKLVVIYNSVEVPETTCHPEGNDEILFLGRLDDNKSPDVLLRAAARVFDEFPHSRLIFAGDGNREHYELLASKLGIRDRCDFLGWVAGDEKEALFERAALLCLPSKNEGMPMSVLEALAHGVPVVATCVGGIPQVIVDGLNGYLMPVGDDIRLAALIERLLNGPELRSRLGANGREMAIDKFDLESNGRKLDDLYRTIVSE